ncbi:UNVERIFIED_CONTAM: hypothetical protein Sangu_2611800 [Sesamum angustifolium]|uniref:Reverse transcriptase Ty1/copia-type domain-containing protein n=1 Tax=Sesamum angustifolium TaxID=2727405 RepID=A0AAW2J586_9LAMI
MELADRPKEKKYMVKWIYKAKLNSRWINTETQGSTRSKRNILNYQKSMWKQPQGFTAKGSEEKGLELKKALYGLKQAPRAWYSRIDNIHGSGFRRSLSEPTLYIKSQDSDWAGSVDDMKSTSGYTFSLGSGIFTWASKKQATVAQSSAEAEYIAAAATSNQAIWLRRVLEDIGEKQEEPTRIYCDNKSAMP